MAKAPKLLRGLYLCLKMAERVGFEPTIPEDIPVFEFVAVRTRVSV